MGIIHLVLAFLKVFFASKAALAAENLALRQQLSVLQRSVQRPKLRTRDRAFWVWLSKLWSGRGRTCRWNAIRRSLGRSVRRSRARWLSNRAWVDCTTATPERRSGPASVVSRLACGTALRHARDLAPASVTGGSNYSGHAPIPAAGPTVRRARPVILARMTFSRGTTGLWASRYRGVSSASRLGLLLCPDHRLLLLIAAARFSDVTNFSQILALDTLQIEPERSLVRYTPPNPAGPGGRTSPGRASP